MKCRQTFSKTPKFRVLFAEVIEIFEVGRRADLRTCPLGRHRPRSHTLESGYKKFFNDDWRSPLQVSNHTWSLSDLEHALGQSIDHGNRIVMTISYGKESHSYQPGPYTFECGCLAVGLTPYLMLRPCSPSHGCLKPSGARPIAAETTSTRHEAADPRA